MRMMIDEKEEKKMSEAFVKYKIKAKFVDRLMGGLPGNPELVDVFLAQKKLLPGEKESAERMLNISQNMATVEGVEEIMSNIFARDEIGLYLNAYQLSAALKEAAYVQKSVWPTAMKRGVRVLPSKLYLKRDGAYIEKPDGEEQFVSHLEEVRTGRPYSAIKKVEFLNQPEFEAEIWVANVTGKGAPKPLINEETMRLLLDHVQMAGIGAMRSMGFGMCEIAMGD
ncbi:MAG: hypothetical protein A4E30_00307 [Methanomassiliicoccales archaeon PtaB.Bin215]|nr:MAG: hypothetical protein A4E30_00307 [Methanomassiliicoccales archaeon PtaB.Bin215]